MLRIQKKENILKAAKLGAIVIREKYIEKYNREPKKCKYCNKTLPREKRTNIFCNSKCAALFNNQITTYFFKCIKCGRQYRTRLKEEKDLCKRCNYEKQFVDKLYDQKSYNRRRQILWEEQGRKCNKCSYDLYDAITGPYQIHHVDGIHENRLRENEELLCANCHMLTDNWGNK